MALPHQPDSEPQPAPPAPKDLAESSRARHALRDELLSVMACDLETAERLEMVKRRVRLLMGQHADGPTEPPTPERP